MWFAENRPISFLIDWHKVINGHFLHDSIDFADDCVISHIVEALLRKYIHNLLVVAGDCRNGRQEIGIITIAG